jgi:hypothetical protein
VSLSIQPKNRLLCVAANILFLLSISMDVQSAVIQIGERQGVVVTISLDGEIKDRDAVALRSQLEKTRESGLVPTVALSSPGGSYSEGILLARVLLQTGTSTLVRKGAFCFSACATAFLGGSSRGTISNPSRYLEPGGKIGFHAPYLALSNGSYTQANVERAYEIAVQDVNDFIRLAKDVFVDPDDVPDLLVPTRDSVFEVAHVFDATNLGIELRSNAVLPIVTASMVHNACINQDRQFRDILRMWRRGQISADNVSFEKITRVNENTREHSHFYHTGRTGIVAAVPTNWFQGGYHWCFVKITYGKASVPLLVSCEGIKWLYQNNQLDVSLSKIAAAVDRNGFSGLGDHDSCLSVGPETFHQYLVPPVTPIERMADVLNSYIRIESPLIPKQ